MQNDAKEKITIKEWLTQSALKAKVTANQGEFVCSVQTPEGDWVTFTHSYIPTDFYRYSAEGVKKPCPESAVEACEGLAIQLKREIPPPKQIDVKP